ncbi:MAG: sulfite exporter TauE/SafE family protein [Acidobacteria bacterium]|nr:sulfite exporter TauE/SafE family protein [Acidobacteriota bacterium]
MDLHLIGGIILSACIGISLGLMGGGGSILTVPMLVYVVGVEPHQAVAMSLAIVGATSLIGTWMHHQHGVVDWKVGTRFGAWGILGAAFGSKLTPLLSPAALLLSFAALMLVVALLMIVKKQLGEETLSATRGGFWKTMLAGLSVGLLTGFLGVGGGFLVVPALLFFGGLTMKDAIGTSLLVITINSAAALVGHWSQARFDLRMTALLTVVAVLGAFAGTSLSHKVSPASLRKAFAVFVIVVALFLAAKNYQALL